MDGVLSILRLKRLLIALAQCFSLKTVLCFVEGTLTGLEIGKFRSLRFSPLTDWVVGGNMTDDSAEILFQSFLQEALVSSPGMGRDVHSLMLSIQLFLCRPRRRPHVPSKVSLRMVLERRLWRVTCQNHANFRLLTVARSGSCAPTRKLILLRTQSLVLCSE